MTDTKYKLIEAEIIEVCHRVQNCLAHLSKAAKTALDLELQDLEQRLEEEWSALLECSNRIHTLANEILIQGGRACH